MRKINFKNDFGCHNTILKGMKNLHIGDWMECPDGDVEMFEVGQDIMITCNGKRIGIFRDTWKVGEDVAFLQTYKDAGYPADHRVFGITSNGWNSKKSVVAEAMPIVLRVTERCVAKLHDLTVQDLSDLGMNVNRSGAIEVRGDRGDLFLPENLGGYCDPKEGALRLMFDVGVAKIRGCYDENPAVLLYRFEVIRRDLV